LVYLRRKKVKGTDYAYMVRSVWDPANKTSKQETIKYLGKVSSITEEMIPIEYRNDPSIISFITRYSQIDRKKNNSLTKKLGQGLFERLSTGDLNGVIEIYDKYTNLFGMMKFFDNLLKPIMYDIGKLWADGELDVATEHVSVNTANTLIKIINKRHLRPDTKYYNKGKIFICTPNGEQHNLACNIIESILLSKGYKVYNASPSLPADSIIESLRHILPDAILISVTLADNIQTAKNLVRKIRTRFSSLHLFVGGLALNDADKPLSFDSNNITVIRNAPLIDTIKVIRSRVTSISYITKTAAHRK
jgi:MerR family transcriptional regulator, light-induced transcriptional regulator